MFSHFPLSTTAKKADYDRNIKKTETIKKIPTTEVVFILGIKFNTYHT